MDVRGGGGDAGGGGGGVGAPANYSNGFIRSMVVYSASPFLFWILTVSLVAVIHLASGYLAPSRSEKEEEAEEARGGACNDEGILGMMQSFMPVGKESEFLEKMRMYDDGGGVAIRAPEPALPVVPEPEPAPAASFSFKFQRQIPEIPSETAMVSRETPVQGKAREEHEQEAEQEGPIPIPLESVNKEELKEEQEVVVEENTTKIVASTHNYMFLIERDFRGFVKEPEVMTVRVEESFLPMEEPEERRVVDRTSHRDGGFLSAEDFRPVNEPDVCESVASSGKAARPAERRKLPGSSPSDASSKGPVSARMSYVSEFSGFDDSDSESSVSDGYSVKDLVVDSDSEWFISEKDFPAAAVAQDAVSLRSYKAKVLKAMEILEEATRLERSLQESSTTASPDSVGQASHDSIEEGSVKYPEDMWSRSPSPDVDFKEEEAVEERGMDDDEARRSLQLELTDVSDSELSSDSTKKMAQAFGVASIGKDSLEHSEKEILIRNDHSDKVFSEFKRSPEPIYEEELILSSDDAKRSREPSEQEFVGTNDHSHELVSDDRKEIVNSNYQSYAVVSDDKRSPEPSEKEFVASDDHAYGVVSDTKNISDPTEEFVSSDDHPYGVVSETKNISEPAEESVSSDDHPYGVVSETKSMSEPAEEEHVRTNDHSDNAARQADVLVTGKKKVEDEEGEEPEDKGKDLTEEEEDELESLWEHQDLVEQLKMELKKVQSIGLPTIMEESETPKAPMEDLKPWKIDAKFLREDPMDELNKFYKSYRERMRKFDILCYQKMYAIDFLQLRGPPHSTGSQKTLSPTVTSILSHNFRSSRRRSADDPSERFLKELRYDLETVYVGQMCLSWEFLRWQYEQARDLPESDPYHSHHYNQVAGEFQQFQVVVQRFIEDESFKGPRLPNYINNRCVLRNLLQVPVLKEDRLKDRMEDQRKGNHVISSEELEDIMEESMRTLWEFIKADKAETTTVLKGLSSTHVELQDPLEYDLMMHIHTMLQKKEKRLKDLLRTGNCLVKKFKKPKEDRSNLNLFFSQVDMKLVARVLRMSHVTSDQLQWCHAKLEKIILVDRKIHREPSFLLFPC